MGTEEQGAERALPDLHERIDLAVGHLTVMAQSLRTGRPLLVKDADALEAAMLLLAGLQEVVAWEPGDDRFTPQGAAEQLRAMAQIGPRPPAVVKLLTEAAGHLTNAERAVVEPDGQLLELLVTAERRAYDIAEDAIAQGRRLAELQQRVGGR